MLTAPRGHIIHSRTALGPSARLRLGAKGLRYGYRRLAEASEPQ
jgi:hypothetical protein